MKRLTLNETWKLCLSMWRWIARQWKKRNISADGLKEEWLDNHGFAYEGIDKDCFFCKYTQQNNDGDCDACPGKMVSERFSCTKITHHYQYKPIAFYNKLVSLNRKRLKKGKK